MMFCYCGKLVWPYDEATWTCKDGHHTAIEGAAVQQLDAPDDWLAPGSGGTVYRLWPSRVLTAALVAAGIVIVELANLLF